MQDGLKHFSDTYLTSIGLLIFFIFFVAVIVWVFRKGSKSFYNHAAQLPLIEPDEKTVKHVIKDEL